MQAASLTATSLGMIPISEAKRLKSSSATLTKGQDEFISNLPHQREGEKINQSLVIIHPSPDESENKWVTEAVAQGVKKEYAENRFEYSWFGHDAGPSFGIKKLKLN